MIKTLHKIGKNLESINKQLHIIARALEAEAYANNSFATDKQLYTDPVDHVRETVGGVRTGDVKEDKLQSELEKFT